ncbi:hypothetical protein HYFRA_00009016 [Hymenoscyphus fraxineus]|uniref:Uncharacterized protein n=1 Tax=Hymenoscyphus fraxineus TaxID=746836 RepID=A0A9N9KVI1_9HELO|nr:hypothetical protein HYFRA_00009016 [Hymenoscyphus fraxineus]
MVGNGQKEKDEYANNQYSLAIIGASRSGPVDIKLDSEQLTQPLRASAWTQLERLASGGLREQLADMYCHHSNGKSFKAISPAKFASKVLYRTPQLIQSLFHLLELDPRVLFEGGFSFIVPSTQRTILESDQPSIRCKLFCELHLRKLDKRKSPRINLRAALLTTIGEIARSISVVGVSDWEKSDVLTSLEGPTH